MATSGQGGCVWSLSEELASPNTPSRILPVPSAILLKVRALMRAQSRQQYRMGRHSECKTTSTNYFARGANMPRPRNTLSIVIGCNATSPYSLTKGSIPAAMRLGESQNHSTCRRRPPCNPCIANGRVVFASSHRTDRNLNCSTRASLPYLTLQYNDPRSR